MKLNKNLSMKPKKSILRFENIFELSHTTDKQPQVSGWTGLSNEILYILVANRMAILWAIKIKES